MEENRTRHKRKQRWCKSVRTPFWLDAALSEETFFLMFPLFVDPFLCHHTSFVYWTHSSLAFSYSTSVPLSVSPSSVPFWAVDIQFSIIPFLSVQFIPPKMNFIVSFNAFCSPVHKLTHWALGLSFRIFIQRKRGNPYDYVWDSGAHFLSKGAAQLSFMPSQWGKFYLDNQREKFY